jgi:hypothetical protein
MAWNMLCACRARSFRPVIVHSAGGPIRTLGVSLLAIAAVAASVLLARQRTEKVPADAAAPGEIQPLETALDAIRAAGL